MKTTNVLIELGVEELPGKNLALIESSFVKAWIKLLAANQLNYQSLQSFSTPRRLALVLQGLDTQQADLLQQKRGPSYQNFAADLALPAVVAFAKSCACLPEQLSSMQSGKKNHYAFISSTKGKTITELLPSLLENVILNLPYAKKMFWAKSAFAFIRPIKQMLILIDKLPLEANILGLDLAKTSFGHRFLTKQEINIDEPLNYAAILKENHVLASFDQRKAYIDNSLHQLSQTEQLNLPSDENLLNEVTGLVEWPFVMLGKFDSKFLSLPLEVLISAMKTHQRCFPLFKNNTICNQFMLVSNMSAQKTQNIVKGNERVMHARLSDAMFHYQFDLKHGLDHKSLDLSKLMFMQGLGSVQDKTLRLQLFGNKLSVNFGLDPKELNQAIYYSKKDLLSSLVQEYPELQGIIGGHLALKQGLGAKLASCISEQYLPKTGLDQVPKSALSCALSIFERLDNLAGVFLLNKLPSGDKDPYALKRQAQGLIRLLINGKYQLSLHKLLGLALENYQHPNNSSALLEKLHFFVIERLRSFYLENDIESCILDAVLDRPYLSIFDLNLKVLAIKRFMQTKEGTALSMLNKRLFKILQKNDALNLPTKAKSALCKIPAELNLLNCLANLEPKIENLAKNCNYDAIFNSLSVLQEPIEQFFADVMVMVDDLALRNNRLSLLNLSYHLLNTAGNLVKL